jgi:glycosyltransferase involved in cell wall biosynthesis
VIKSLTVRGPFRGPTGHDHHTREFVRHLLAAGVRIQLLDVPAWGPRRLAPSQRDPLFDALSTPVGADIVLHFCMPHQVAGGLTRFDVNFTMFEATRVPQAWVDLGLSHDLVVVPTPASRDAWTASGFPEERLRLCPLGVDGGRFHPDVTPLALADRDGRSLASYRTRVLNVSDLTARKNLLGLLRVWLRETSRRDDAILILKVGRGAPGTTVRFMREVDMLERQLGRTRRQAAPVLFMDHVLDDAEMPGLFAAATHYWSMSHGEGWDQPMMEAAATGLRLIAPRHSAYPTYLDEDAVTWLPARRVIAWVPGDGSLAALFRGAEWWDPDEDAATEAIRAAIRGDDAVRPAARARLLAEFTWPQATTRLLSILAELQSR